MNKKSCSFNNFYDWCISSRLGKIKITASGNITCFLRCKSQDSTGNPSCWLGVYHIKACIEAVILHIFNWKRQPAATEKLMEAVDGLAHWCLKRHTFFYGIALNYNTEPIIPTPSRTGEPRWVAHSKCFVWWWRVCWCAGSPYSCRKNLFLINRTCLWGWNG